MRGEEALNVTIAFSLLLAGGMVAMPTATIVCTLRFTGVILLLAMALSHGVRDDWNEEQHRERACKRMPTPMEVPSHSKNM